MASVDTDRNLLFGVLALQGELIDAHQFAEVCSAWSLRKDRPLADHLVERGWILPEDRRLIERLLEHKLRKHSGDAHQSLMAAAVGAGSVLATIEGVRAGVDDEDIRQSLADVPGHRSPAGTIDYLVKISPSP